MRLDSVLQAPRSSFRHAERYVHFIQYPPLASISDLEPKYASYCGDAAVDVPVLWAPRERFTVYETRLENSRMSDRFIGGDLIGLPVHPQVLEQRMCPWVEDLRSRAVAVDVVPATPMASQRTFLTLQEDPLFSIKTHYVGRIGRYLRDLRENKAKRSQWLSDLLTTVVDAGHVRELGFFPELVTIIYPEGETFGATLRDHDPYPALKPGEVMLPLFALYATDLRAPEDPPLIQQISDRHGRPMDEHLIQAIVAPLAEMWGRAAMDIGILLDAHGQNLIVVFDENWNLVRFCVRDLGNVCVWPERLAANGHRAPDELAHYERDATIGAELSVVYDCMLAGTLYDPLVRFLARHGFDPELARRRITACFGALDPELRAAFPETEFQFVGVGAEAKKIDSGEAPRYR